MPRQPIPPDPKRVRPSEIVNTARELKSAKKIQSALSHPVLHGWTVGRHKEKQPNQPAYHKYPFPVPLSKRYRTGRSFTYPRKYLFLIIAWHEQMMHPEVGAYRKLAPKLEREFELSKPKPPKGANFVDSRRIEDLHAIKSSDFDLAKLIRLCEELNDCYRNQDYFAVAMLTRAVVDHVPPIFKFNNFAEVANNYKGVQSFKDQMQHLENSLRKIADAHLHIRIRSKEDLPSSIQVNFANDIDVLLGEIVRILK